MLKLKRFLKPFLAALGLAIALLFVQALCDLNLPNLMSNIVNVGIQQGGVEDGTPRALSDNGYRFAKSFMSEDDQKLLDDNYQHVQETDLDSNGQAYQETWPQADGAQQLYVLEPDVSQETLGRLDTAFGSTTWTMMNLLKRVKAANDDGTLKTTLEQQVHEQAVSQITQSLKNSDQPLPPGMSYEQAAESVYQQQLAKEEATGAESSGASGSFGTGLAGLPDLDSSSLGPTDEQGNTNIQELDMAQIYQLQPLLDILPASWFADARAAAATMDPTLRNQSATMLTAAFYKELGRDMTQIEISYITRIGLLMLLVTVISGIATVLVGYISSRVGAGLARNLRSAVFSKVMQFSNAEFDRFSTASLITRSTNDITVIQMLVVIGVRMICYAPIMGIGGVIMALRKSVSMSWIIVLAVVVLLCIIIVLLIVVMPKFKIMQKLIDRLNLVARETLSGLMVIRAFNRDDFEKDRFKDANTALMRTNLFVNRAMTFLMPIMMLLMNGLTILIIWVGAHQVAASQMQVGDMMAYMQYVMMIMVSFMFVAMIFVFVPRASVSAGRIAEVLETEPSIIDPAEPVNRDDSKRGLVEFKKVTFRFDGAEEDALWDVSFKALPGQTVAFIGPTGSGKSTILNLIPRFYDVTAGAVEVDGVDVRQLAQSDLRSRIGYVPQKSVLMGGTIASNISYGVSQGQLAATKMDQIAAVAQASEIIAAKEEGYDFEIAQGGSNVSGGQRQRLSIARALAIDPDIYLFDDSFSALDFSTDAALRKALREYTKNGTLLIVAQRIGTIMDADVINVVENGHIVGCGSHSELLASCPAYYEIAASQLSEAELGAIPGGQQAGAAPGGGAAGQQAGGTPGGGTNEAADGAPPKGSPAASGSPASLDEGGEL
ncbi:MAG: ABC transporter ATP-binding protein/permease [Actinomycetia bacterium]|nr:ABC transporter ATP-binding protein/permease [Actinomycetes bacterium]